ncbi:MAG: ATPase [Sphingomonadaceae bacterium]|nr:ATPase [Sphingomonadaceae bacterium]
MKRFYKDVAAGDDGGILLDGRAVKTPARAPLALPTTALADAVAEEWRAQGDEIDPRAMPLTGLANAAIDRVAPDPVTFGAGLAAYAESDLLYYRADHPAALVARQAERWDPLLNWARTRYDVHFELANGIVHRAQPKATLTRLGEALAARAPFALAAFSPLVTISGSLVIALALAEGAVTLDGAWQAAMLDELWQEEQWGEDSLATQARDARRRDFEAAAHFLALLD